MTQITITHTDGRLIVSSPYTPEWSPAARKVGGKWHPDTKTWSFDARDEAAVKALLGEHYGWIDGNAETVDLRLTIEDHHSITNPLRITGRMIARRPARDAEVRLADGVVIIDGGFGSSGGSVRNPDLFGHEVNGATPTVTLEVRGFPASAVGMVPERFRPEIVSRELDRDGLAAERERLLARIAEIDALLAE